MNFAYISHVELDSGRPPRQMIVTSDPIAWAYCLRGESLFYKDVDVQALDQYDLAMIWLLPMPETLDKYLEIVRAKQTKTIVYVDMPVGIQCATMDTSDKLKYIRIMREADFVFTYKTYEGQAGNYFDALAGGRKIHYVNIPYPVEYIRSIQMEPKDKIATTIELAKGFGCRRYDRNFISSWAVFARMQKRYPEIRALCHPNHDPSGNGEQRTNNEYMQEIFGINVDGESFLELRMMTWMDYVRELSPCYMGIHLDMIVTRGQFALECAGLRIACICSGSDGARQLFPQTFVENPWDITKAAEIGCRLIEDKVFYEEVADYAEDKLISDFSYKIINEQVREITGIV